MRILLVTGPRLDPTLGGAKAALGLAPELERLGWEVELLSLAEAVPGERDRVRRARAEHLRALVARRGASFDVVDFDHQFLPFPRHEFPARTLLVARSVLLLHWLERRRFPQRRGLRGVAGSLVHGRARRAGRRELLAFARRGVEQADLVNVSNPDDAALLGRLGLGAERIVVLPFGLSEEAHAAFAALPSGRPHEPVVAFVGTFDWRKGAADMPAIVAQVREHVPEARFRLLGTSGLFASSEDVLRRFPRAHRRALEVVPSFAPEALPALLADCALGFFPSYLEGFGFGALELMAASLPVVAYDAPGARSLTDRALLVPVGDRAAMAGLIASLLSERGALRAARTAAAARAERFRWREIALDTDAAYLRALARLRGEPERPAAALAGSAGA